MTFCTHYESCSDGLTCERALTPAVLYKAKHVGLPISQFVEKPECYFETIRYFAIGREEINRAPKLGKIITCGMCGKRHRIKYGKKILRDGSKEPSTLLAFYKCKGNAYLAGIDGMDIRKNVKK